nr:CYP6a13 [Phyllotreta striolata]
MELISLIYALVALAAAFYFFVKWRYTYWSSRNVVALEPTFFYGNLRTRKGKYITLVDAVVNAYKAAKAKGERYAGVYLFITPQFIPLDREIIRSILFTHFDHFLNRGIHVNEKRDPLSGNLFNISDNKWRVLRTKLTPAFTTGKMKMMFDTVLECTTGLEEILKDCTNANGPVDIKDVMGRFTTDVIGSVAFGLEFNSMKNGNCQLRQYGKYTFENNWRKKTHLFLAATFPTWFVNIVNEMGFSPTKKEIETYFLDMVQSTVDYGEKNTVFRRDALHLLIQLKNMGKVLEDDEAALKGDHKNVSGTITMNELAAQAFIFFIAGFETSATTMTFALLELALNPDVQEKLREEIKQTLKKNDNKLTYESVVEMEYLEKVVCETMRKHPPFHRLARLCNKDFKVPNSDLVIKSQMQVLIPVLAIHNDPEYYPNPEKFDPERFSKESIARRPPLTYFPFGDGPRNCLALRFGKLQAKLGLCTVVSNYNITLNEKTKLPIEYELNTVITVKDDVWLNLERLEK